MKKFLLFFLALFAFCRYSIAQDSCPVIPLPAHFEKKQSTFLLHKNTPVITDEAFRSAAYFLQKELLRTEKIPLSIQSEADAPAITLKRSGKKATHAGSYSLNMDAKGVTISAPDAEGAFYGVISLLQISRQAVEDNGSLALACWNLQDSPKYDWRGLMLDESRQFFGKEKVKSILNWMAFYKLNRFHWHLTDAPGWRLEIKKYPKLALIGGTGNHHDENAPATYYTQEDINEIVRYAAERHITVIPEIDMPGHATAANKAYPEFSGGGSKAHPEFTFNPGKEGTYQYLSDILRETRTLFPAGMIHLGGDEVSFGNEKWQTDPEIRSLMNNRKLADVKAVERYFMERMADSVYQLNSKVLAWDEMADANLPPSKTIIFWWRHDKPEQLRTALNKGYAAVLCPRLPLYFDFVQDSTHRTGRKWDNLYNPLEAVYAFSHEAVPAAANKSDLILGIQANLWTETVVNEQRLDYLLFPRISALAEAAWATGQKDYQQYLLRLKKHIPLYAQEGLYAFYPFSPAQTPEPFLIKKEH